MILIHMEWTKKIMIKRKKFTGICIKSIGKKRRSGGYRKLWLQDGDKSSSFFHKQATVWNIRNKISSIINTEGIIQKNQEYIKAIASNHYKKLLTKTAVPEDYLDLLCHLPNLIMEEINNTLKRDIEEAKIKNSRWYLQPYKSPGPDGFSINFYRTYWDLIKKYLIKMI